MKKSWWHSPGSWPRWRASKIKRKIGWPAEQWEVPARPFLTAFYRAQRGRLEQRLLFGERRERKKG